MLHYSPQQKDALRQEFKFIHVLIPENIKEDEDYDLSDNIEEEWEGYVKSIKKEITKENKVFKENNRVLKEDIKVFKEDNKVFKEYNKSLMLDI